MIYVASRSERVVTHDHFNNEQVVQESQYECFH